MTGREAREGKQALASVIPLGSRQIGFHYSVCLFSFHILQLFLSSSCLSFHLSTNSKTIFHAFSCTCSAALFLLLLPFCSTSLSVSLTAHHFISLSWAVSWAELHRLWLLPDMSKNSPSVAVIDMRKLIQPNPGACCVFLWVRGEGKGPSVGVWGREWGCTIIHGMHMQ